MPRFKTEFTGINIQYPISRKIISGDKTIETRTYPLPEKFRGIDLLIIETPGKEGNFKSRIIGKIRFSNTFKYKSQKDFYNDIGRHHVDHKSPWAWNNEKPKWGWKIEYVEAFKEPVSLKVKTGILYTNNIRI